MFCGECGAKVAPGEKFCGECGAPIEEISTPQVQPARISYTPSSQNTNITGSISGSKIISILTFIATIFVPMSFFMPMLEANVMSYKFSLSIVDLISNFDKIKSLLNLSSNDVNSIASAICVVFILICVAWLVNCIFGILNIKEQKLGYSGYIIALSILLLVPYIVLFIFLQSKSSSYVNITSFLSSGFYVYIIANIATLILSIVGVYTLNKK